MKTKLGTTRGILQMPVFQRAAAIATAMVLLVHVEGALGEGPSSMGAHWTADEVAIIRVKANAGDRNAQCLLAALLASNSLGAPKPDEAFEWYHKAAVGGETDAKYNLGLMYLLGEGVERNADEGSRWLVLAANDGHDVAAEALAEMYETGSAGLTRDEALAISWYGRAADLGNARAKYGLGLLLLASKSSGREARAVSLIREAADSGVRQAIDYLRRRSE